MNTDATGAIEFRWGTDFEWELKKKESNIKKEEIISNID